LDAVSADVTLLEQSGNGKAILVKGLYNDPTGEIVAVIGMNGTQAAALLVRCVGTDCIGGLNILLRTSLGPAPLNTTHTLFLQWDGTLITYQLDSLPPFKVNPAALGAPFASASTGGPGVEITAESLDDTGPNLVFNVPGTSTVTVDNVRAGPALTIP